MEQLESAALTTSTLSAAPSSAPSTSDQTTVLHRPPPAALVTSTDSSLTFPNWPRLFVKYQRLPGGQSTVFGSESDAGASLEEELREEDEGFAPSEDSPSPANSTLTPIEEEGSDVGDSDDASSAASDVPLTSPARRPPSKSPLVRLPAFHPLVFFCGRDMGVTGPAEQQRAGRPAPFG